MNTVLLAGIPRSGTTLNCYLLNKLPDLVALNEPMNVLELQGKSREQLFQIIDAFTAQNRDSILTRGTAVSINMDGKIPDNPCSSAKTETGLRSSRLSLGEIKIGKKLSDHFTLVLKHNAAFTALLNQLKFRYSCFGVVRNPLPVLVSWNSVDMPVFYGHSPVAELLDPGLKNTLNQIPDKIDRQLYLYNWFFLKITGTLPPERIIRYERLIFTGGKCLSVINKGALQLEESLSDRSGATLIDPAVLEEIVHKLSSQDNAFNNYYSQKEIEDQAALFEKLTKRTHNPKTIVKQEHLGPNTPEVILANRHANVGPSDLWKERRYFQITFLKNHGLRPCHQLMDLGCGTLRGGIPLIAYLDAGNYLGIEVRQELLAEAKLELMAERLQDKNPSLIYSSGYTELTLNNKFDLIWAFSVLIHLDDETLHQVAAFTSRHLKPGGAFYANVNIGDNADTSWKTFPLVERSLEFYLAVFGRYGFKTDDMGALWTFGHVIKQGNEVFREKQRMLKLTCVKR